MSVVVGYSDTAEGRAALERGALEAHLREVPLEVLDLGGDGVPPGLTGPDLPPERVRVTGRNEHQDVAAALLDHAVGRGARLIVIGTRRRSPVGKFLLGSIAQRVLLDAEVPVLVVKTGPER